MSLSRRSILGAMATAAAPVNLASASVATASTLDERIAAAKEELIACLSERYGASPTVIDYDRFISVFVPPSPESVEYSGQGFYKVEGKRPDGRTWCTTLWLERVQYKTVPGFYYRAETWWKGRLESTIKLKPKAIRIIRKDDSYGGRLS
ncbi:hypothetical protein GOE04_11485 [Sinorhizobium medicae]|uniref:hypothetical protein n=1 Tax=Sinorhizobium medicae TaxID=110321 RepID=UPI001AAD80D3|nr:hypothetical protein [Sinorhizobium medicae]MBO1943148.1 hypothetical protein [Sinorhizobium medicae]MDX0921790.1 hypothetical protein [Sinorhizobium medicae]MDX0926654.1 hypothetical protein [Sinorhizobium medicae]MDX0934094.1 hypothetical protein [Sinorhizobium medicae]MDX0940326.1 hypothetical protein [Sinorhizobium medicae]